MEKLKLIRENAELFKKHVQDMENLENQKINYLYIKLKWNAKFLITIMLN